MKRCHVYANDIFWASLCALLTAFLLGRILAEAVKDR
jgi:hypothetical protein